MNTLSWKNECLKGYNTDGGVGESGEKGFLCQSSEFEVLVLGQEDIESGDCAGIVHGSP